MKKPPPLGLVVEGKLTQSPVLRSPAVLAQLGPVKAKTRRLAKRATNYLGAGTPVDSYEAMNGARLVLIHVPDAAAAAVIREIAEAPFTFVGKAFVLCETWMSSAALAGLGKLGAATASCMAVPTARTQWFVLEGDGAATRPLRRLLDRDGTRAIEIRQGRKDLLFAAEVLAGILPLALLGRAEQALRASDLSGRQLRLLLDGMLQRMLQESVHGQRNSSEAAFRRCPPEVAADHMQSLLASDPELVEFLRQHIALAGLELVLRPSAKLKRDEQAVPLEIEGA